jgi:hypothetical protein
MMPTNEYQWLREQIIKIASDVSDIRVDVATIKQTLASSESKITDLEKTVYGNGTPGLKTEVQKQKAEIEKINANLSKDRGWIRGIAIIIGWIITAVIAGYQTFRR